jgi:hypothetical protein
MPSIILIFPGSGFPKLPAIPHIITTSIVLKNGVFEKIKAVEITAFKIEKYILLLPTFYQMFVSNVNK